MADITSYTEARGIIAQNFQTTLHRNPTTSDIEAMTGNTLAELEAMGVPPQKVIDTIVARLALRAETMNTVSNIYTTLAGVPINEIQQALDARLAPDAYTAIPYGTMRGKTDIDPRNVRDRFDEVFGPCGVGWRFEAEANGDIEVRGEVRKSSDGSKDQTWYVATLKNYTFSYAIVDRQGQIMWCKAFTVCDMSDNLEVNYAMRGAISAGLKQVLNRLGGMNHIYSGRYTHIQAQQDLARMQRKAG